MYNSSMKLTVLAVCAAAFGLSQSTWAVVVNCPTDSIQAELDAGETFIEFTGICDEFVTVRSDGTHIKGTASDPAANVVSGGLAAEGKQSLTLENLTINAPDSGVFFTDGAYVNIRDSIIEGTRDGLEFIRNAGGRIEDSEIGFTTGTDPAQSCGPLCALENSSVRLIRSQVSGSVSTPGVGGVLGLFRDSSATLRGGNIVINTGTEPAIQLTDDSSMRIDNPAGFDTDVVNGDVSVFGNSYFDIREGTISGDVSADLHSVLRFGSRDFGGDPSLIDINGNVTLSNDSALQSLFPVQINGNLTCEDDESSVGGFAQVSGSITGCTRF